MITNKIKLNQPNHYLYIYLHSLYTSSRNFKCYRIVVVCPLTRYANKSTILTKSFAIVLCNEKTDQYFYKFKLNYFIIFFANLIVYYFLCYRNIIYNLSIFDLSEQQRLVWYSPEDDVKMCVVKGKDEVSQSVSIVYILM